MNENHPEDPIVAEQSFLTGRFQGKDKYALWKVSKSRGGSGYFIALSVGGPSSKMGGWIILDTLEMITGMATALDDARAELERRNSRQPNPVPAR